MIQFTEGIKYQEKLTRFWMWRTLSDNNPAMDLAILDRVDVIIGNQSDEEGDAKALAYRNVWMIRCLGTKELWFQDEGSEAEALIKRWKLNRLRGAPDQILSGQEPAHNRSDVGDGKKISKD